MKTRAWWAGLTDDDFETAPAMAVELKIGGLMGNNQAFADFEYLVVTMYDKGILDQSVLSTIMERHRDTDIDSGGKEGTLSKDGLDCEEITCKIFGVAMPDRPQLPKDHLSWTEEQNALNDEYWERRGEAFDSISREMFGWS